MWIRTKEKENIFTQYLENTTKHLGISEEEFFKKTKERHIVKPKQMLYYMCQEISKMKPAEIMHYVSNLGYEITFQDILYGINTFKKVLEEDKDYKQIVKKCSKIER